MVSPGMAKCINARAMRPVKDAVAAAADNNEAFRASGHYFGVGFGECI
jgi:hypothetical protein